MNWISCKESLPENGKNVLIYSYDVVVYGKLRAPQIDLAHYSLDRSWSKGETKIRKVTHWMPLPQPPEVKN